MRRLNAINDRRPAAGWRLVLALGASAITGCTMIVDVSDYDFCTRGALRCSCKPGNVCDQGLECRPPGLCIDPNAGGGAAGAGQ